MDEIPTPQNTALRFVLWVSANLDCTDKEMRQRYDLLPETEQWRLKVAVKGVAEETRIGKALFDGEW